jgi:hypothetical protein
VSVGCPARLRPSSTPMNRRCLSLTDGMVSFPSHDASSISGTCVPLHAKSLGAAR